MTDVSDTLDLTVHHPGPDTAVLTVAGDLDLHTAPTLRARALTVVTRDVPHLVMDLTGVDHVDSTGLSTLITLLHATREAGGSLRLAQIPGRLMRMVTLTGISHLLPVYTTVADALTDPTGAAAPEAAAETTHGGAAQAAGLPG
ncbi:MULTISPECIES: STAS domain-containing protein [Streptomyces]|uniref:STAS domain-containing protein n=1 Tax=Streptomyces TaxID=1883 RepID=UPI0029A76CEB|nr:STAS domain-containing protein [Streptomyces sp. WI03-4A]MDX2592974.1 STAS domain-containing protein [Streptomyces sp. WI03-4A]